MSVTPESHQINDKREIFGWTMYDWANSAFSTTVGTVFLGPYLTSIAEEASKTTNGYLYLADIPIRFDSFFTYCVSASVLFQVTFLPILGTLADYSHLRKRLLMLFSTIGALTTLLMFFIRPGGQWMGGLLFIVANLAFGASIVFYNSFLPSIASADQRDHVSAQGFALGYVGGGLLLCLNLIMFLFSEALGLSESMVARISLASAGVWWLVFSMITFRTLRSRHAIRPLPPGETYISMGFNQLASSMEVPTHIVVTLMLLPLAIPVLIFLRVPIVLALLPGLGPLSVMAIFMLRKSRTMPEVIKYLIAYLLYNDGIQTVIAVSAIYAAEELGMAVTNRILVILMIQFVAFGGAYGFSFLARRLGTRNAIVLSLVVWSVVVVYAFAGMQSTVIVEQFGVEQRELEFWILGSVVAIVLGGSQALSRSLFAQMIPQDHYAEFFSFYEVSERGTSWMGTFVFGVVNQSFGSMRMGILSVIFFFVSGLLVLLTVDIPQAIREAKNTPEMVADSEIL